VELAELTARALEVHRRFNETAAARGGRAWTREEIMQGFVGDVGDLMKLTMAKAGARPATDLDRRLAHELCDCLWSVLVLAKLHGVDIEKEFPATMAGIEAKLAKSG
jgi:NTP pyrophosphatase (non-canonical NTP hydrolase)